MFHNPAVKGLYIQPFIKVYELTIAIQVQFHLLWNTGQEG
jgi:hypothetical protein